MRFSLLPGKCDGVGILRGRVQVLPMFRSAHPQYFGIVSTDAVLSLFGLTQDSPIRYARAKRTAYRTAVIVLSNEEKNPIVDGWANA